MKGKLLDLSISLSGKQRLMIEIDGDFRNEFDRLYGKDIEVTVKQYRQKEEIDSLLREHEERINKEAGVNSAE